MNAQETAEKYPGVMVRLRTDVSYPPKQDTGIVVGWDDGDKKKGLLLRFPGGDSGITSVAETAIGNIMITSDFDDPVRHPAGEYFWFSPEYVLGPEMQSARRDTRVPKPKKILSDKCPRCGTPGRFVRMALMCPVDDTLIGGC